MRLGWLVRVLPPWSSRTVRQADADRLRAVRVALASVVRAVALGVFGLVAVAACSGNDIGGTGGSPACTSCYEVYVNGGITCGPGPSVDAWHELANSCACGDGKCVGKCTQTFCQGMSADMDCGACLESTCPSAIANCAAN
jgi:hypothetical protein